jgi:hypothetical protein
VLVAVAVVVVAVKVVAVKVVVVTVVVVKVTVVVMVVVVVVAVVVIFDWQAAPSHPVSHRHVKVATPSTQVPCLLHLSTAWPPRVHSLMLVWQVVPA